jgi:hypothetical protein
MKTLIGTMFLVLVWTAFSFGGEPVPPVVPHDQAILSERLDEVNDILEGNELSGKKVKSYCEHDDNTWEIAIKDGVVTGTLYPWDGGSYPVTGTKKGKTISMRATGLCGIYCCSYYEITVTKVGKRYYEGTNEYDTCPGYDCAGTGDTWMVKGSCD